MKCMSDDCDLQHCSDCRGHISGNTTVCSDCLTQEGDERTRQERLAFATHHENVLVRVQIAMEEVFKRGFKLSSRFAFETYNSDMYVADVLVPDTDSEDPTPVIPERFSVSFRPLTNEVECVYPR